MKILGVFLIFVGIVCFAVPVSGNWYRRGASGVGRLMLERSLRIMRQTIILPLLASVWFVSGCGDHHASDYTKGKPDAKGIPGVYVMTPSTLKMVRGQMHYPAIETTLVLKNDNTFELKNMPDCWAAVSGTPNGRFDHGKGEWRIQERKMNEKLIWWEIDLNFENSLGITSVKPWDYEITEQDGTVKVIDGRTQRYGHSANLINQASPYVVRFTLGDPDSGVRLEFERKSKSEPGSGGNG